MRFLQSLRTLHDGGHSETLGKRQLKAASSRGRYVSMIRASVYSNFVLLSIHLLSLFTLFEFRLQFCVNVREKRT